MSARSRGFTPKKHVEAFLQWLIHFLFPLTRSSEFLLLTPPALRSQIVLDLKRRRLIRFRDVTFYDVGTLVEVFVRREYLPAQVGPQVSIREHYEKILANGETPLILDLGANIGAASAFFALHFPKSLVVAVEPDWQNYFKLESVASQFSNIKPVHGAVAGISGEIPLYEGEIEGNNALRTHSNGDQKLIGLVPCFEPISLISKGEGASPFLVKIDIEGFESELFSHDPTWLDTFPVVAAEPHDWMLSGRANSRSMISAIQRVRRDLFLSGENIIASSIHLD